MILAAPARSGPHPGDIVEDDMGRQRIVQTVTIKGCIVAGHPELSTRQTFLTLAPLDRDWGEETA